MTAKTERDTLAKVLWLTPLPTTAPEHYDLADAILSSDWLAEHDRETRDEALVEAAASFEGPDRFIRAVDVRRRLREGVTR